MTIAELIEELREINQRLQKAYDLDDARVEVLARMTKISEELGELSDEVLSTVSMQRKDKLGQFRTENVAKELADVIVTVMILGITLDIDVEQALVERLAQLKNRKYV